MAYTSVTIALKSGFLALKFITFTAHEYSSKIRRKKPFLKAESSHEDVILAWPLQQAMPSGCLKFVQVPWVKFSYGTGFILRVNLN